MRQTLIQFKKNLHLCNSSRFLLCSNRFAYSSLTFNCGAAMSAPPSSSSESLSSNRLTFLGTDSFVGAGAMFSVVSLLRLGRVVAESQWAGVVVGTSREHAKSLWEGPQNRRPGRWSSNFFFSAAQRRLELHCDPVRQHWVRRYVPGMEFLAGPGLHQSVHRGPQRNRGGLILRCPSKDWSSEQEHWPTLVAAFRWLGPLWPFGGGASSLLRLTTLVVSVAELWSYVSSLPPTHLPTTYQPIAQKAANPSQKSAV